MAHREQILMPVVDCNQASYWQTAYTGGYSRANTGLVEASRREATQFREVLGVLPGEKVVIVGGGFGFMGEEWVDAGIQVAVTEISTWINANKGPNARADITLLNESGTTNNSRRNIRAALGNPTTLEWGISEDVLPVLTNAEGTTLASNMRSFCNKVAHLVSICGPGPTTHPCQYKTLEQWKALVTPDLVVQRGSFRVL
jgi:hypothetical protein